MYKFTKQHKDSAIGDVCTYTGDYLQALIDAGIVEEVKNRLKGMPSMLYDGKGFVSVFCDELSPKERFLLGDHYPTKEAADEAHKHAIAKARLQRACHEISGGENGWRKDEKNWVAICSPEEGILCTQWLEATQYCEQFLHLRTEAQAQRLIDEHSDALKVYLGVE